LLEMIATSANAGPNAAKIESWDGAGGRHWVAEAERYDSMTRSFGERIIEAAAPRPGERVLDVADLREQGHFRSRGRTAEVP
jgi:hypothetical protein